MRPEHICMPTGCHARDNVHACTHDLTFPYPAHREKYRVCNTNTSVRANVPTPHQNRRATNSHDAFFGSDGVTPLDTTPSLSVVAGSRFLGVLSSTSPCASSLSARSPPMLTRTQLAPQRAHVAMRVRTMTTLCVGYEWHGHALVCVRDRTHVRQHRLSKTDQIANTIRFRKIPDSVLFWSVLFCSVLTARDGQL